MSYEPKGFRFFFAAMCNDRIFLNAAGIGFDGEVMKEMGFIRFLGGQAGYYFAILKSILFYREQPFQITGDKLIYKGKLLLVIVNNSSTTGGGFNVSPLSSVTDGMIDLIVAHCPLPIANCPLPIAHCPLPILTPRIPSI